MSRASEFLLSQYSSRKNKNPKYSQRAFARLINVNSGRLNQYFTSERMITKAAAMKIADKLDLSTEQKDYFVYLCEFDRKEKKNPAPRILKDDELAMVVEWYHLAILSLASTKDFRLDHQWIAKRLGLPLSIVVGSLERLERIGMIEIVDGKLEKKTASFVTTEDIPNKFLIMSHQDRLRHIVDHVAYVPVEKRDISSITLAVDSRKLPEAKKMIRVFRRRLAEFVSTGKKDSVYTINVQLFPFTKEVQS